MPGAAAPGELPGELHRIGVPVVLRSSKHDSLHESLLAVLGTGHDDQYVKRLD